VWWNNGDWGWGGWLAMAFGMVAFWGLVIWAILAIVRTSPGDVPRRESTPEQIVAERFARGEIDEDDYRRRLAALRDFHTSTPDGTGDRS
jgi:putative membrane protein